MQDICLRINEMEVGMDEIVPDAEAWAYRPRLHPDGV